ncbi:hypothetical protein OG579_17120 [Williamsia herbipolensis]|uniref:DUF222 domain-containing protein n=1 Tax=Williamsia herbipolensis TaxID=1603258 RepID=A0AAU4K040_9NOCA|nr:hypothetical protein [Williamsia herbipolensis]
MTTPVDPATAKRDALLELSDAQRELAMSTPDTFVRAQLRVDQAQLAVDRLAVDATQAARTVDDFMPEPADTDLEGETIAVDAGLDFGDGLLDDSIDADDPLNEAIPIRLGGLVFKLQRPSDSALALSAAELYAAPTLMEQYLAMLKVIQTSLEHAGMQLLRQKAMGPRVAGKQFDDQIVGTICATIFERWGQGRKLPESVQQGNRVQRRQAARDNR